MSQPSTPDPSWKGLPPWLFFAFLVFGPPAALVAFTRTVTQNPLLITLIVLGYWTLLFLGHLARKIWQQLEEPLTKYIARWLTIRIQEMTSRYYRQYYRLMVAEHQVFDVKGLSTRTAHDLALEQVFVDLHIHPLPPHQASSDPIRLPELLQGTHSMWDYLSNPKLANPHLVILGAPGSGKTTLLKHLALTLAQAKRSSRQLRSHSFPILLFLRDHAQAIIEQPTFSLANAVEEHIQRKWQQTIPASWIDRFLERGKCLILLDGLDEVADSSTRQKVIAWVQKQLIPYGRNRFVLTSRPYGYRENPLDGVTVLDVEAFTSDQVERFIQNWYLANELKSWGKDDLSVHLHAREGTHDLLKRLHQAPALLSLTVNPLLLTMIATVHRYRSSLPGSRVALYGEIYEVFLGKRHEARGIAQELSPAQKQQVLQPLAYWMMQHGKREVSSEEACQVIEPALAQVNTSMPSADFLRHIEETSGLLLERTSDIYGFAHLTFQEYLAAVHIKEEKLELVLVAQVANSWWHETIRLYCAQADATAIIQTCLANNPLTPAALVLAFECDEEKLKIQPQALTQLNEVLKAGVEDPDWERRRVIAEVLLTRRVRQMIHLRRDIYIDTSLITCAEYQMFLDEQRGQNHYYQPDHWRTFSFPKGSGSISALGVRRSDALVFCDWLTTRDKEGWQYRLPRAEEAPLERKLTGETGYWVEGELLLAWSQGKPSDTLHQQLSHCIDYAHAHASERASNRDHDFSRSYVTQSVRTSIREHNLDHDRIHTRALDLARALDLDFAHTRALDLIHALSNTPGFAKADILDRARAIDRILDIDRASMSDLNRILDLALDYVLDLALDFSRDHVHTSDFVSVNTFAFDLYTTLFLLQSRIARNLPVYEGILLVKERQTRSSGSEL